MPEKTHQELQYEFAAYRSHKASEIAYDLCKVTAQACLLVNGGAATAVIAYLSKEKIDPVLINIIPWCLGGYGIGVLFSALMMFCLMMNADYWNYHWYYNSYDPDEDEAKGSEKIADRWYYVGFYGFFGAAIFSFLGASTVLAWALLHVAIPAPVPPGMG